MFGFSKPLIVLLSLVHVLYAYDAAVLLEWSSSIRNLQTQPTLQVVVNPLLLRHVPQSKAIFQSLANLGASTVRFVPWLPYPRLAVAALEPPSGHVRLFCSSSCLIFNSICSFFAVFDLPMMAKYLSSSNAPVVSFLRLIL
jgi:hypothetical protein